MSDKILPKHIGIIMDGNGRWAKLRGLPRQAGHKIGAKTFQKIVRYCNKIGVQYLTVYAFSTENWKRPQEEIRALIEIFREQLKMVHDNLGENVKVKFLGDMSEFDEDIREKIADCEESTKDFLGLQLNVAMNYGGRNEIIHATKKLAQAVKDGEISPDDINEDMFSNYLFTKGQPDVDLIIRPSGEYRTSNFLIWQSAYAEYIFMNNVLWPDFTENILDKAIDEFAKRNRRFGAV